MYLRCYDCAWGAMSQISDWKEREAILPTVRSYIQQRPRRHRARCGKDTNCGSIPLQWSSHHRGTTTGATRRPWRRSPSLHPLRRHPRLRYGEIPTSKWILTFNPRSKLCKSNRPTHHPPRRLCPKATSPQLFQLSEHRQRCRVLHCSDQVRYQAICSHRSSQIPDTLVRDRPSRHRIPMFRS